MNQLTRRNFLKALAGLPALALLKSEAAEAAELDLSSVALDSLEGEEDGYLELVPANEEIYLDLVPPGKQVRWNGAGDSWESVDGGKSWTQTGFRPTLEVQSDGTLYVSGAFLEETPEEVRQRHWDYIKALT